MTTFSQHPMTCALLGSLVFMSSPASAGTRPVVVELFTSQSCSSCPPADSLLGELAHISDVVALGFHISYWDGPGWRDPFSSQSSTDRQRAYARLFDLGQVYSRKWSSMAPERWSGRTGQACWPPYMTRCPRRSRR